MTASEVERLVQRANQRGIRKVKLTGGEVLLREDIVEIVRRLAPLTDDLSLTTNGTRLAELASKLKQAGLDRVNVSLHTLRDDVHRRIVGADDLNVIKRGIETAIEVGLFPVKINMTILRGYNEGEIGEMMEYAGTIGAILQLIELQPMPTEIGWSDGLWVSLDSIERGLEKRATQVNQRSLHGRRQYTVPLQGKEVLVEIVRPHHNSSFCARCTRLRVTSDGRLKPCLLRSDNLVDVHDLLKTAKDAQIDRALELVTTLREPYWKGGDDR